MNIPKEFQERMKNILHDEFDAFIKEADKEPLSAVRINTLKPNAEDAFEKEFGKKEKVSWCSSGYYCNKSEINGRHPYHMAGLFYFQEPSAMIAAEEADIHEGDFVLDLCAAPGGKSTQAAAKLNGTGLLVANEIIPKRARILSENIERMGIKNAIVTNESPDTLAKKYPAFFDKIIVDAPCSGEGMFRKEPKAIEDWSPEHVYSCALRQKNILDSAVTMLKNGGILVYSTCTFSEEENEGAVEYLIDKYNLTVCKDNDGTPKIRRIYPHREKGEGHFAAVLKKNWGEAAPKPQKSKPQNDDKLKYALKLYKDFEKNFLNTDIDGEWVLFGDNLYLKPICIDIDKIKVVRCGLHMGIIKKNRFEPAHALALALNSGDFKNVLCFSPKDKNIYEYLSGATLPCEKIGYTAVCAGEYPLGWGKASGSILKNHYPKALRIM